MDGKSRSYMRAVCAVLAAGLLTAGCGKEETAAAETAEIAVPEAAKRAEGSETTASAEFFSEFKNTVFIFSRGAGAWRTELQIREDGSLSGRFEDANMGEIGEENPQGTIYESVFTGLLDLLSGWMKTAIRQNFWKWNMRIHWKQRRYRMGRCIGILQPTDWRMQRI